MVRVKVKVVGSGKPGDPFRVDLPTYQMIPDSEEYDKKDPKRLVSVTVDIPADECDGHGQPSPKEIRRKYREQPRWDRPDVAKDVLAPGFEPGPAVFMGSEPIPRPPESLWSRIKRRLKR